MRYRQLGATSLCVPGIVFGGNVFGWTADRRASFELLDACVERGLNVIDTADVYTRLDGGQGGESESMIGEWIAATGRRHRIRIISKCGFPMGADMQGLSPHYIQQAVEASLRRLRADYIDLYMAHCDDPEVPLADTLGAFDRLRDAGKIGAIGASNYRAERLREAMKLPGPHFQMIEAHYNLCERTGFEDGLAPICREAGLGVLSYFTLASGFLTGKYDPADASLAGNLRARWIQPYLNPAGARVLREVQRCAAELGAAPAQVALAWTLAQPDITACLASARNLEQFGQLVGALDLQLPSAAMVRLQQASSSEPA